MALTSVILLASGTLAFSLATMSAAALYADSVMRKELRTQAALDAEACLDTAKLMAAKDYFISGTIQIRDFGCVAEFTNDLNGHISMTVSADLSGVSEDASGDVFLSG